MSSIVADLSFSVLLHMCIIVADQLLLVLLRMCSIVADLIIPCPTANVQHCSRPVFPCPTAHVHFVQPCNIPVILCPSALVQHVIPGPTAHVQHCDLSWGGKPRVLSKWSKLFPLLGSRTHPSPAGQESCQQRLIHHLSQALSVNSYILQEYSVTFSGTWITKRDWRPKSRCGLSPVKKSNM